MAKIVIAGSADCPHLAKVELLADQLSNDLPNFSVHKIIKQPADWPEWLESTCSTNGWSVKRSPIVWRELVHRGGKGVLIGGPNEFQEYAKCYYGVESTKTSEEMTKISMDNVRFKEGSDTELAYLRSLSNPMKVCLTNACSPVAYHLIPQLAEGNVIGSSTEISLILYAATDRLSELKAIQMETFDMAYPLLRSISITDDLDAALKDCSLVVLLDELVSEEGETRNNWLRRNVNFYREIGTRLDKQCSPDVKVLLAPCNDFSSNVEKDSTNSELLPAGCHTTPLNLCLQALHSSIERLHRFNVVGLTRGFERRIKAVLAQKLSVNSARVVDLVVWGNLSGRKSLDLSRCRVSTYDGAIVGPDTFSLATEDVIWEKKWLLKEVETIAAARELEMKGKRGTCGPPGLAGAHALASLLRDWSLGSSRQDKIYSLAVSSEGEYSVPEDLVFSFPVNFTTQGYWSVVQDMDISETLVKTLDECVQELMSERNIGFSDESADFVVEAEDPEEPPSLRSRVEAAIQRVSPDDFEQIDIDAFLQIGSEDELIEMIADDDALMVALKTFLANKTEATEEVTKGEEGATTEDVTGEEKEEGVEENANDDEVNNTEEDEDDAAEDGENDENKDDDEVESADIS